MKKLILLFLLVLNVNLFAQENGQFPITTSNEDVNWLVSTLGEVVSKKTAKKFYKIAYKYNNSEKGLEKEKGYLDGRNEELNLSLSYSQEDQNVIFNKADVFVRFGTVLSDVEIFGRPILEFATNKNIMNEIPGLLVGQPSSKMIEQRGSGYYDIYIYHEPSQYAFSIQFVGQTVREIHFGISSNYQAVIKDLIRTNNIMLADVSYTDEKIILDKELGRMVYEAKSGNTYVFGQNFIYKGPIKNGVPHGIGRWGFQKRESKNPGLYASDVFTIYEGEFENGFAINSHTKESAKNYRKTSALVFTAGVLTGLKGAPLHSGGPYSGVFNGAIDTNQQFNDPKGEVIFSGFKPVEISFIAGQAQPKNITLISENGEISITTYIDSLLRFQGDTRIAAQSGRFQAELSFINGKIDPSIDQMITLDTWSEVYVPKEAGKVTIKGKFNMTNILSGRISYGENLRISYENIPDSYITGTIRGHKPEGKHTLIQKKEGQDHRFYASISERGEFISGTNFYELQSAKVLSEGSFKDPRDGKSYATVTLNRLNVGKEPIIWMSEYLEFNPGAGVKIRGGEYYYNSQTALSACPPGWRPPDSYDIWHLMVLTDISSIYQFGKAVVAGRWETSAGTELIGNGSDLLKLNITPQSAIRTDFYGNKNFKPSREQAQFWLSERYAYNGGVHHNTAFFGSLSREKIIYLNPGIDSIIDNEKLNYTYLNCRCVKGEKIRDIGDQAIHLSQLVNDFWEKSKPKENNGWVGWGW